MRATATSNKRNSSSSSVGPPTNQSQRKSAKGSNGQGSSSAGAHSAGACDEHQVVVAADCNATRQTQQQQQQVVGSSRQGRAPQQERKNSGEPARHRAASELLRNDDAEMGQRDVNREDGGAKECGALMRRSDAAFRREMDGGEDEEKRIRILSRHYKSATSGEGVDDHRKQTHNVIEKRRRDKMNNYIMELASVIPTFTNNQSKFDKLTVLRMAVQHVKSLRSSLCSFSSFHLRPSFLSSGNLLKNLILQMASQESQDNLFMVVTCDRGKVLFVSESSKDILNHEQHELVGQCLFDIVHKDDVSKVKEQISYINLTPKEMLVDSKTLQPIKHNQRQSFSQLQNQANSTPQPGARRSFFCRMRSGRNAQSSETKSSPSSDASSTGSPPSSGDSLGGSMSAGASSASSSPSSSRSPLTQSKQTNEQGAVEGGIDANPTVESSSKQRQQSIKIDTEQRASSDLTQISSDIGHSNKSSSDAGLVKSATEGRKQDGSEESENSGSCNDQDSTDNKSNESSHDKSNDTRKCKHKHKIKSKNNQQDVDGKLSPGSSHHHKSVRAHKSDISSNLSRSSRSSSSGVASNSGGSQTSEQSLDSKSSQSENTGSSRRNNNQYTSKTSSHGTSSSDPSSKRHWRYIVMHCTGYLKSITLRNDEFDDDDFDDYKSENNSSDEDENDDCRTINCLVAVCRRSPMDRDLKPDRPLTFTCRYSMQGKFVFVDQRTTVALGYTPQQLLGTSHYAYCHKDSVNTFKECHSQSIQKSEPVSSDIYQFKRANGQHLWLQTSLKSFRNPWTKIIDYIVANHTTAEGSDPHYNDGSVPTKFNQDMTGGEGSQSSSPTSSFTLSLPSVDSSKKSSSPSSSSIGSSFSMDSCASSAYIQNLLNRIDRAKSGGVKYALDLHRRKGDSQTGRSNNNSSRNSEEDSGFSSEPQSCSSLSFPNNPTHLDYPMNVPFGNYFGESAYNETYVGAGSSNNQNLNAPNVSTIDNFRPAQEFSTNYQVPCQMVSTADARVNDQCKPQQQPTTQNTINAIRNSKTNARITGNSISSDTGNESASWSTSSGSVYSTSSNHRDVARGTQEAARAAVQSQVVGKDESAPGVVCSAPFQEQLCQTLQDKLNPYVMQQSVENTPMNIVPAQVPMQDQMNSINGGQLGETTYSSELLPATSYISQDVTSSFNDSIDLSQMQRMTTGDIQSNQMPMTAQNHQSPVQQQQQTQTQQQQQQRSQNDSNHMNMPMMWNTTTNPNAGGENLYQNLNTMHTSDGQQICNNSGVTLMNMDVMNPNNLMISQQRVQCQQCANNKCTVRQIMMTHSTNNTDLNCTDLTSLAVDGDLDEDQMIEYLAGCEPSYHLQNNSYPQYNIYR